MCEMQVAHRDSEESQRAEKGLQPRKLSDLNKVIFRGIFMIADFNKILTADVHVVPDNAERLLGTQGRSIQKKSYYKYSYSFFK